MCLLIVLITLLTCKQESEIALNYNPPYIEGAKVTDTIFGKLISDPYRNIENTQDSTITNWYKDQTQYTQSYLERINGRDSLIKATYEIDNRKSYNIKRHFLSDQNNRFYLKKNLGESYYKLYQNTVSWDNETFLFDPKTFYPDSENDYTINYIRPSWNDNYVVVSLSYSGKEVSELIIIDTKTKERLPVILNNAWPASFLGVKWLPDNSGFTYLYFPQPNPNHNDFRKNNQAVLYKLGQNPEQINYIFGNKTHPQFNIKASEHPCPDIDSQHEKYIISYIAGVDKFWDAYYAKIENIKSGELDWKPFYKKEQKIRTNKGILVGDIYYFLTSKNSENYELAYININTLNFDNPKILFSAKKDEVIDSYKINKDVVYVTTTKYGIEASLYKIQDGTTEKIEVPKKSGKIRISSKSAYNNDIWVSLSGWVSSNDRYKYNYKLNTFKEDNLSSKIEYQEFENIVAKEVMVSSHDGEKVPLSIIHRKDIEMDGNNPSFFYGYGFYGDDISPFFSPLFLKFVEEGGVLCIPHVRGGGEKGESWRTSGFKTTKPNSWKDLIACVEYMINQKYTSKDKTAIYSSSAGGILVGRAMTDRPDLFAAVVSEVGVLNPTRMETQPGGGGSNIKEFGTMKDSTEAMALIEMDPYLHIKDSTDYPATYLTVGMNDPRVVPWESGKFAARLQNTNLLKKPVLLYADFDAGHEGNSSEMKVYEEWGNVFSFVFWQTGHPNYQLKEEIIED